MLNSVRRFFENFTFQLVHFGTWTAGAGTDLTTWIDASDLDRIAFWVALQNTGVDGAVSLVVRQAKTSSGGTPVDLADDTVTAQLTATTFVDAATPGPRWAVIHVETRKLKINDGYRYIGLKLGETATGALTGVIVAVTEPRIKPATQEAACLETVNFDG